MTLDYRLHDFYAAVAIFTVFLYLRSCPASVQEENTCPGGKKSFADVSLYRIAVWGFNIRLFCAYSCYRWCVFELRFGALTYGGIR